MEGVPKLYLNQWMTGAVPFCLHIRQEFAVHQILSFGCLEKEIVVGGCKESGKGFV